MSTTTVRRPKDAETAKLPEWRRLCHWYDAGSERSVCGIGIRKPGEDHCENECKTRGHAVCVICSEMVEKVAE